MKIKLNSVLVDDQDKALKFYTEVLGFEKKTDMQVGEFKWLTVVSPEGQTISSCFSSRTSTPLPGPARKPFSSKGYP